MKKLLLFLGVAFCLQAKPQCVNTFPYVEDFETSAAWTTSISPTASVAVNDWTWGTPNHTYVIKSAGSGNNCWCAGGLTGAFYNYWEHTYVVSPCFDFTNLPNPGIQFKLFYETQARFDGGNLQSSIDGGTTWQDVGSVGGTTYSPIIEPNNCYTQNWYNQANLLYLNTPAGFVTSKHGWSGNVQAGGVGWDATQP
ncbi:MAG TPA: hypothetical protein VK835_04275, partial [Bacteroidia bacterium]|nr:hypothetical protein [Bacteroidia bacterium]